MLGHQMTRLSMMETSGNGQVWSMCICVHVKHVLRGAYCTILRMYVCVGVGVGTMCPVHVQVCVWVWVCFWCKHIPAGVQTGVIVTFAPILP